MAVFKPGQKVEIHKHDTMFEVFHIHTGKDYRDNSRKSITIKSTEIHGQSI